MRVRDADLYNEKNTGKYTGFSGNLSVNELNAWR